jgi:hypothetical protein
VTAPLLPSKGVSLHLLHADIRECHRPVVFNPAHVLQLCSVLLWLEFDDYSLIDSKKKKGGFANDFFMSIFRTGSGNRASSKNIQV